jgi:hypothetical protein
MKKFKDCSIFTNSKLKQSEENVDVRIEIKPTRNGGAHYEIPGYSNQLLCIGHSFSLVLQE